MENYNSKVDIYNARLKDLSQLKSNNEITDVQFIRRKLKLNNDINNFIALSDLRQFEELFDQNPKAFLVQESEDVKEEFSEVDETYFWHDELDDNFLLDIITTEIASWKIEVIGAALEELLKRCK